MRGVDIEPREVKTVLRESEWWKAKRRVSRMDRDAMDEDRSLREEEREMVSVERWDMRGEAVSRDVERSP